MSTTPPSLAEHLWHDHAGQIVTVLGFLGSVVASLWAAIRWRDRRRDEREALLEMVRCLADEAQERLSDNPCQDVDELREQVTRRRALLDNAAADFAAAFPQPPSKAAQLKHNSEGGDGRE